MLVRLAAGMAALVTVGVGLAAAPAAAGDGSSVGACRASDLRAKQTDAGAGMSQPWIVITLTNRSGHACRLHGYPAVTRMATSSGSKPLKITNGVGANMPGRGPSSFIVAPGQHAWFAVGTATAYDPPVLTFVSLSFRPTASGTKTVTIHTQATGPTGKPIPVYVSAYAPGTLPPQ